MGDAEVDRGVVVEPPPLQQQPPPPPSPLLSDLVERLRGRRNRRYRRVFVDGEDSHYWDPFPLRESDYQEWRLRMSVQEMLDLLDHTPEAADTLLHNFLLNKPGVLKVVWFTNRHVIMCEGPGEHNEFPDVGFSEHRVYVSDDTKYGYYWRRLVVKRDETLDEVEEEERLVLHLLHNIVALGTTGICKVGMDFVEEQEFYPGIVPGVQDYVSLPRTRRTVGINSANVSSETGRILAYHCSPTVQLEVEFDKWQDRGVAMAEAMVANQCPRRLSMGCCLTVPNLIAPALAANTSIEELAIEIPSNEEGESSDVWDAVARNRGIKILAARPVYPRLEYRYLNVFWKAALTNNGAICHIDASKVLRPGYDFDYSLEKERRECTEMIATLIRSNPRITSLEYHPVAHDVHIMEERVMPIVYLNRFRPIVHATFRDNRSTADSADAADGRDQAKEFSALMGSPLVRSRPELLYVLLKAGRDYLLSATTANVTGRRRASVRRTRKRRARA